MMGNREHYERSFLSRYIGKKSAMNRILGREASMEKVASIVQERKFTWQKSVDAHSIRFKLILSVSSTAQNSRSKF